MKAFLRLLTAALEAYVEFVRLQRDRHLDALEDRLDALASIGDPHSKLLMERVAKRIDWNKSKLLKTIASGGFILTAKEALRENVADARVKRLRYAPLPVESSETKVTTSLKTTATPEAR